MPRYSHVLWDWNGTLLDDLQIVVDVMNGLLAPRGLPALTVERYREIFVFPVRHYYAAAGLDLDREPFPVLAAEWITGFEGRWREAILHREAAAVLAQVTALGLAQSVLSAAEESLLGQQARHFGVDHHFHELAGTGDHHAEGKVDRGLEWLAGRDLDPGRVLLVGDTTHDAEVARALGIDIVLIDDGHQSRARLESTGAPVLGDLGALLPLLAGD